MEHVEKNKHVGNPTKSKGVEHLELGRKTMDFGSFIKAKENLAQPGTAPVGKETASMQGGDNNVGQLNQATNSLTENVERLLKNHSKEDIMKVLEGMEADAPEGTGDEAGENAEESGEETSEAAEAGAEGATEKE